MLEKGKILCTLYFTFLIQGQTVIQKFFRDLHSKKPKKCGKSVKVLCIYLGW